MPSAQPMAITIFNSLGEHLKTKERGPTEKILNLDNLSRGHMEILGIPSLPPNYEYRIWHVNADSHPENLEVQEYTGINKDNLKDARPAEFTAKIRFY